MPIPQIMTVLDAAAGAFFQRELEYVKKKTYDIKYADLTYDKVFPVDNEANPGASHITYHTYDQRGMAKVIHNYAGDLPRVDVDGVEHTVPVRTLGDAFGYTIDEINGSKMVGKKLDTKRANAARRACEELMNTITYSGDAKSGLIGLFTHPNIPKGNAPNPGSGTEWSSKTAAQIKADVDLMFRTVFTTTKMVERPDTLLVTPENYLLLTETVMNSTSDTTIAEFLVKKSAWLKSIDSIVPINELVGAGTAGVDVAVAMTKNPEKCEVQIPQDVFFHEAEKRNLEYITNVTARFAGLNVYYPLSMYILEKV